MISRVLNLRLNHSWLAIPRLLQTYISQGGTEIGKGGPVLAAKIGLAGPILAAKLVRGDQFWQKFLPKMVRPDQL